MRTTRYAVRLCLALFALTLTSSCVCNGEVGLCPEITWQDGEWDIDLMGDCEEEDDIYEWHDSDW